MQNVNQLIELRIPASTSNLGAGFDCFGLALQLYLKVKARIDLDAQDPCIIELADGNQNESLSRTHDNLIYRAMAYAAERQGRTLPPVHLEIDNSIPVSRGLGGSAAAIIAGIKMFDLLCNGSLSNDQILRYATELEGHADNAAPSLLGGFAVNCTGGEADVISLRHPWPADLKVIVVVPETHLDTKLARAALSEVVNHCDAVFNLQRAALFVAALSEGRYDVLWEAMQDRLHQQKREKLVPGLAEALAVPKTPGLAGVALSGAGPSVVALAIENFTEIGAAVAAGFERHGIPAKVLQLEIDTEGTTLIV
jgi:homoserine kinase